MFCNGAISAQEAIFVTRKDTFNFSAGPSVLPEEVLQQAQAELLNYHGTGMSVMEMSHRSQAFSDIFQEVQARFRSALSVPDTHAILFLQGGGTSQFSMIPLNLMGAHGTADYAVTGHFSGSAAKEAEKYGTVHIAADTSTCGHTRIPQQSELQLTAGASYFYYCANNTIYGTEWQYVPETGGVPLACDMSSDILSRPVDVSKYGVIFAGAQKNMAPAGLTVVIIREDLIGHARDITPTMFNYQIHADNGSMYNTPPTYPIYICKLVLEWLKNEIGGLEKMAEINRKKAALLYDFLDHSEMFSPTVHGDSRSMMNIPFVTGDAELDKKFVKEAEENGFVNLKGHRSVGGMRASIYNAMPLEGVEKLVAFMKKFEEEN